jgi:glucose/arabinose dehydrogenase
MARDLVASLVLACAGLIFAPALVAAQTCAGDCAGEGTVSIDDLIRGVNIALGLQPVSFCAAMDSDGGGTVSVGELIQAVNSSLDGCPPASTPTASAPTTTTASAAATATTTLTASPPDTPSPTPSSTPGAPTATATTGPTSSSTPFCDLPGSVQRTGPGLSVVPGGPAGTPDLSFIDLPIGFCVHYFANVGNTRRLRFAPGGDLFVASPTGFTTSNGQNGRSEIVVLPDDDHDGTADQVITFMINKTHTTGLLFSGGYFYYQDNNPTTPTAPGTRIMRVPFTPGDRSPSGESEQVTDLVGNFYSSFLHWPKAIDIADDGTIYVTNGGDEVGIPLSPPPPDRCDPQFRPSEGRIFKLGENGTFSTVARGFRNPASLRCVHGRNLCFAVELTRDYSTPMGGREKLFPVRDGDDWGHPCCATKDKPYSDLGQNADCSGVASEIDSFFVGNTPFDLDYELGRWPDPWGNRAYVAVHGAYSTWEGARIVGIELDAMTGQVLPGSDLPGMKAGAMRDFATGWELNASQDRSHGRPTVVTFAPDGRLFMGNDTNGDIIWMAPFGLAPAVQ